MHMQSQLPHRHQPVLSERGGAAAPRFRESFGSEPLPLVF